MCKGRRGLVLLPSLRFCFFASTFAIPISIFSSCYLHLNIDRFMCCIYPPHSLAHSHSHLHAHTHIYSPRASLFSYPVFFLLVGVSSINFFLLLYHNRIPVFFWTSSFCVTLNRLFLPPAFFFYCGGGEETKTKTKACVSFLYSHKLLPELRYIHENVVVVSSFTVRLSPLAHPVIKQQH